MEHLGVDGIPVSHGFKVAIGTIAVTIFQRALFSLSRDEMAAASVAAAAVGEDLLSRRLAAGERPAWRDVFAVIWAQRRREVSWMAFVMLFVFWVWMYQVRLLIALCLGLISFASFEQF
ncbi:MAG: hypothetical protein CVV53_10075, partial [Spirochaetae bacterium HGW-Spirochaetae-9]